MGYCFFKAVISENSENTPIQPKELPYEGHYSTFSKYDTYRSPTFGVELSQNGDEYL